jgi:hypothetical protein
MPTLEERVDELESQVDGLNSLIGDFDREIAILKGRNDGLEAVIVELQSQRSTYALTSLWVVDSYNLNDSNTLKAVKSLTGNFLSVPRIWFSDDRLIVSSYQDSFIVDDNNDSGEYPTKRIRQYANNSQTGQDLVLQSNYISKTNLIGFGFLPTSQGQRLIINKQQISSVSSLL